MPPVGGQVRLEHGKEHIGKALQIAGGEGIGHVDSHALQRRQTGPAAERGAQGRQRFGNRRPARIRVHHNHALERRPAQEQGGRQGDNLWFGAQGADQDTFHAGAVRIAA